MSASNTDQDRDIDNLLTYCDANHIYFSFDNLPGPPSALAETVVVRRAPEGAGSISELAELHNGARKAPMCDAAREVPPASVHDMSTAISMDDMFRLLSET